MLQRKFKDSIFTLLYGAETYRKYALDLYSALNHSDYTDPDELEMTTIEDVLYLGVKNDVSFLIGDEMQLWEHQSTYAPNMPLRGLQYFSKLYSKYTAVYQMNVYGSRQLILPTPKYYVFYIGKAKRPECEVRLTSSFADPEKSDLEVTCTVININVGCNAHLMEACHSLAGYSKLVSYLQAIPVSDPAYESLVDAAVDRCIEEGYLVDFLTEHRAEVVKMYILDMTYEQYHELEKRDIREEALAEGKSAGIAEGVSRGIAKGIAEERHNSIRSLVQVYREDMALTDKEIVQRLVARMNLTEEEAKKYVAETS